MLIYGGFIKIIRGVKDIGVAYIVHIKAYIVHIILEIRDFPRLTIYIEHSVCWL